MTILQAHEHFAAMGDAARHLLHEDVDVESAHGVDVTPALLTAACELSGGLGDAQDLDDLQACVEHFNALLSGGVVTVEEWTNSTEAVICELLAWGDQLSNEVFANELN